MNIWDWHYRIYFDDSLKEQLLQESSILSLSEKQIVNMQIEFYTSFYSFGILFDNILDIINNIPASLAYQKIDYYLTKAEYCRDQLIELPVELYKYYIIRINNLPVSASVTNRLKRLLRYSLSGINYHKLLWKYLRGLFGNTFQDICTIFNSSEYEYSIRELLSHKKRFNGAIKGIFEGSSDELEVYERLFNITSSTGIMGIIDIPGVISNTEVTLTPKMINDTLNIISTDEYLECRFGKSELQDFDIIIDNSNSCWGEWWDREVIKVPFSGMPAGKDQLLIHSQHDLITREQTLFTLIHEVYPGHGHFYNKIRNPSCDDYTDLVNQTNQTNLADLANHANQTAYKDFGAMTLYEGWATYCEWNAIRAPYIQIVRHDVLNFLQNLFHYPANMLGKKVSPKGCFTNSLYRKLILATQYLGYYEAYYMGSLWFENYFNKVAPDTTPNEFLIKLQQLPKGDFFELYAGL